MLTIDMRMIDNSGIGIYLANLVPLVIERVPNMPICILGNPIRIQEVLSRLERRITIKPMKSPIYSVQEQWELYRSIPKETTLFWSPHYNIPVFYSGKLLVTVHDVFHKAMPEYAGALHKRWYASAMFQAVRRKATRIISVSEFTKEEFHKFVGEGSRPIQTIHNGIHSSWFAIEKRGSPIESPFFLFVGNVKPNKNIASLIKAYRKLMNQVPHKLVIVGKKDGFITGDPNVWKEIDELGDRVLFTGYVNEQLLHQYYVNAEALVFPSIYEGFGFPPLEAMAAGIPVLASQAASLPEVCGDAALYFDPTDENEISSKMLQLLQNTELRDQMRVNGWLQAQKYRWQTCADQTVSVIREVVGA